MKKFLKIIKKIIISVIIIINLGLFPTFQTLVYSQESSSSAVIVEENLTSFPTPTITQPESPTTSILENINLEASSSPTITPSISPITLLIDSTVPLNSAIIEPPVVVHPLEKKDFQGNEKIKLILENIDTSQMKLSIKNDKGKEVPVFFEESKVDSSIILTINSTNQIKPGKYTLTIVDHKGQETVQEFTWGVLAINPNKSIYLPWEEASFSMAVLDNQGRMVCDTDTILEITSPDNIKTILSTEDGSIKVNPECLIYDVNLKPDYEAVYQTTIVGVYGLVLKATTKDGEHMVTDHFEVRDSVPFEIERTGPTRIYVPMEYEMNFNIKFNQDFNGKITETVPNSFTLFPKDNLPYESTDITTSDKRISSVDTINLIYPFTGDYAYSQLFGVEETDPIMKAKYENYGLIGHDGLDFELPSGTPILAVDDGEIVLAEDWDYGQTIIIKHEWGKSYYGHLSEIKVTTGQIVNKGNEIGLSGDTGLSTGPHLHFGMKMNKNNQSNGYYGKISPLSYLGKPAEISDFSIKQISWNINAKAGESITLGYDFLAPNISPQFYLLGGLKLTETDQMIFEESRQWQIDADASDILYPAADVAIGSWTNQSAGTTNLWDTINEGTVSYNDSDYVQCGINCTNDQYDFSHTSSLSDVETVTAITVRFRGQRSKNKTTTVTVFYCASAGCTPSTAIGTTQAMTDSWAPYSVTASSLSISKANIDNLRVRLQATSTGGARAQVSAAQVDLTYDPVVTGPTNEQLMRHGKWFNSSGARQPFTF